MYKHIVCLLPLVLAERKSLHQLCFQVFVLFCLPLLCSKTSNHTFEFIRNHTNSMYASIYIIHQLSEALVNPMYVYVNMNSNFNCTQADEVSNHILVGGQVISI